MYSTVRIELETIVFIQITSVFIDSYTDALEWETTQVENLILKNPVWLQQTLGRFWP